MKKLLLVLVVAPTLLFAQQNNAPVKPITGQGNCNPVLALSHHDKDTCKLSVLAKYPYLSVPCGRVISFWVSIPVDGIYVDKDFSGNYLSSDVIDMLKSDKYDCSIIIKQLNYTADDGSIKTAHGMLIHILKK